MIRIENAHKRYRWRKVLDGVTFSAEKGQITCLVGMNGAGKSTLLKAIMGLTPLSKGSIRVDGVGSKRELYEKVSFIPDHAAMPGGYRLEDGLQFMADYYKRWNEARANELMAFFRLDPRDRVGNLSKGTAAKYGLVLGLAADTEFVLMDEPFSGIDVFSREMIGEVFSSRLIEDRGVLVTTHEIGEIEYLLDRAILLKDGKVARDIDCEQVRDEQGKSVLDVMREVYRS
ncbi:ABC-2 type transport system ATP-binding protein [Cohnella sp. OV330]|uniref:ATP-binding cassette domain-containing protein n=1 Tax=Cohnella sp. OV330 TaxID=1855288 RepID=UPI0008EAE965|nr:ABC transporter ATP-binding protein [Cohnella sp. OV330]SFB44318.1 ABC-2 type transport system ATP-binding protein [Cohnella sp. OV330]